MMLRTIALVFLSSTTLHAAAVLTTEHADIAVNFSASLFGSATNPWRLTVRNEDARIEYGGRREATADEIQVVLDAVEASRVEVPNDMRYSFLGPQGREVYILPQTQEPDMLYLGTSSENKTTQLDWQGVGVASNLLVRGTASGTFQNNRVNLRLASFSGPGDFFLYSTNTFGDPTLFYNTANGLSLADNRQMSPGNHTHFNWAFTEPGEYTLGLIASGTLLNGTYSESDLTEFHFNVVPEPSASALALLGTGLLARRKRLTPSQNKPTQKTKQQTHP
jgi:surface-anchored protein